MRAGARRLGPTRCGDARNLPEYDRAVALPPESRHALAEWLSIRTAEPGPLLLPVDSGGLIRFRRVTDQAVYDVFGRIVEAKNKAPIILRI